MVPPLVLRCMATMSQPMSVFYRPLWPPPQLSASPARFCVHSPSGCLNDVCLLRDRRAVVWPCWRLLCARRAVVLMCLSCLSMHVLISLRSVDQPVSRSVYACTHPSIDLRNYMHHAVSNVSLLLCVRHLFEHIAWTVVLEKSSVRARSRLPG